MSIKIKKQTGEIFDLPADFVIEVEKNSPLFSKKGSQTVSISFPATPHNRRLLGQPARLDRAEKPGQAIPVAIEAGPAQQTGLLAVNSASPTAISASIGFDEAELYSRMSEIQLKDMSILNDPSRPEYADYNITMPGASEELRVHAWLSHLTQVMKESVEADYFIFPVVLQWDRDEATADDSQPKTYRIILNQLDTPSTPLPYGFPADLSAFRRRVLTWKINGERIYMDAPTGYGVSPFLKVGVLIDILFAELGFTVKENPFRTHRQLKKLVVLNNVMDTVLSGTLHYRDMMPNLTLSAFLDSLYSKFGLLYFIDSNQKNVRLRFLKDILSQPSSVRLDAYKTEEPEIAWAPQKQLKLTCNRSVGMSAWGIPTETLFDLYEDLLSKYGFQFTDSGLESPYIPGVSNLFHTELSLYNIVESIDTADAQRLKSSDFFDWNRKTPGLEYEEIKMEDACLPFDLVGNLYVLHYGANMQHHYSDMIFDGETAQQEENPAPLAFVFGWGMTDFTAPNYYNYFYASQINRNVHGDFMTDPDGNRYDVSLTINREDGLFNRFWKAYDAFLRHSNQQVECKLRLPQDELVNLKTGQVMMLNFQPLLPEQFSFKLNDPSNLTQARFRTLRLYRPYDLLAEQGIFAYQNQKYRWQPSQVNVPQPAWEPDWIDAPRGGPGFVTIDGTDYNTKLIFFLPPTEDQFLNQETVTMVYHTVWHKDGYPAVNVTSTVTYTPAVIVYP